MTMAPQSPRKEDPAAEERRDETEYTDSMISQSPDYKRLFLEERLLRQEAEREKEQERLLRQEAECEKEQERLLRQEAEREKEQERRKNQKTTLEKYLYNCHFHLYQKLGFADKSKFSRGLATRVEGKYYPKWLRPWNDFSNTLRQQHFEDIKRVCGDRQLFPQESTTWNLGADISLRQAGNENAIDHFEKSAVEDPVWKILAQVGDEEGPRAEYRFMRLRFSNNIRDFTQLSDVNQVGDEDPSEETQERRRRSGPSKRVASEQKVNPLGKPDGGGVRTRLGGDESLAFVYDYKATHKFAVGYLRPAVAREKLFMEVIERTNSEKSRDDAGLPEQDIAEAQIAMALIQVFDYMINYGVAYGYVAAGESLVFLHIDRADLQTMYYHVCVPNEEVDQASAADWADKVSHTAVAQLASFCMLSLRSEALKGESLDAALRMAKTELKRWKEPYEDATRLLGAGDADSPSAPSSQGTDGSEFRSDARPAGRKYSLRSRSSCRAAAALRKDDVDEDDEPDGNPSWSSTGTSANKRKEGPSSGSSEDEDVEMSDSAPARRYCTQACLLGLKRGWDLDDNCPNVLSHRTAGGGTRHPIDTGEFVRLVGERLRQNPYRGCMALDGWGKMGATGVLFKLELAPYGYTFVGKGTLSSHLRHLQHESRVYAQLERLQGEVVPVYLGIVGLARGYVLPGGARVVHMMLMSWGGEVAGNAGVPDLAAEVRRSSQAVWAEGVNHGDNRDPNLLWNDERRRVMLIDFDRAALIPTLKHKQLFKLSGQKRKRQGNGFGKYTRKRGLLHDHLE